MPNASPRYSPVGSKLSVNPNDCSQPTRRVPPLPTWVLAEPPMAATEAATATANKAAASLIGLFTLLPLLSRLLPPPGAPPRRARCSDRWLGRRADRLVRSGGRESWTAFLDRRRWRCLGAGTMRGSGTAWSLLAHARRVAVPP